MKKAPKIRFDGYTEDWEQRKCGDVFVESRDIGHSGDIAKKLTVKLWGKGVYPKDDIGSAATQYYIRHAGQFIYSKLDFLNSAFGVVPEELDSYESTADLPAFDCNGINPYFMYYRAIQPSFYITNGMIADGSRKAKRIHADTFLNMPLMIPSKGEQDKISDFLQRLDHLITLHQKEYEVMLTFKEYMLIKMFPVGNADFPDIRLKGYSSSWRRRRFSDFSFAAGEKNKNNLPLEPYAITKEYGFIVQNEAHEEFGYMKNVDRTMYIVVEPNSFAYNPARINIGSLGYYEGTDNVIVSSLYEVFQTDDDVDDTFLKYWFKTNGFQRWVEKLQEGSVRLYFYYDKLCECTLMMPSLQEQRAIGQYFRKLDELILLRQREVEMYKKMKQYMLQNMFV